MNAENIRLQLYIFLLAVPLNLVWEVAQISAYDFPEGGLMRNILGCFLPTLGDGLMILIIYWAGWAIFRKSRWILNPGVTGYLLMIALGLSLALFVEWNAIYWTKAWAYNERMIVIPVLRAGLLPVLQMMLLPPATALLLRWVWRHRREGRLSRWGL